MAQNGTDSTRAKLLVVDGHSLVFRAWFAMAERLTTKAGVATGGALGFTRMLLKVVGDHQPTHIAVAFDTPAPTFRKERYPQYKAHRPPTDPELHAQIPIAKEVLDALGVPIYEKDGYEADDVVGTLCHKANAAGADALILTGDSDQLQLVNDHVQLAMYTGFGNMKIYDVAAVRDKFDGLGPDFVAQIKALAGDKSDNIPGVPKIGDKTALALLNHFGGLEQLFAKIGEVSAMANLRGAKRIQGLLEDNTQQAWDSYELAQIVCDVPLEFDLADARFGEFDNDKLRDTLLKYEFNSLLKQLTNDTSPAVSETPAKPVAVTAQIADNNEQLQKMLNELASGKRFAYDVETDGLDPQTARIVGLSFACDDQRGWYVPLGHDTGAQLDLEFVLENLRPLFEDANIAKVAHNANFDMSCLVAVGIGVRGVKFDTMIAAVLCGIKQIGLKQLAPVVFGEQMTPISDLIGTGRNQITLNQVDIARVADYAVADAVVTWRLAHHFEEQLQKHQQGAVFNDIEIPFLPVVVGMQAAGMLVDTAILQAMSDELAADIDNLKQAVAQIVPEHEFNINSPRQIGELLFDKLQAPALRRAKTGWSVDENVLETLMTKAGVDERVRQIADGVLKYRELAKLKSTYVDTLPELVNARTGRVHTTFNQVGSETGRLSSTNPNIQNIPVRTALGRRIRSAFHADTERGFSLLSADYSQIELRILAHISEEASLLTAFRSGEDIHTNTAQTMYDVEEVTAEQRRVAKILNFGVIYGLGPYGIVRQTNLTYQQGKEFIALYFGKYAGIKETIEQLKADAHQNGYAQTIFGRRRYLPMLTSGKGAAVAAAERVAINMPIQGTAADIVKIAMVRVAHAFEAQKLQSRLLAQIHDEVIFEVLASEADAVAQIVKTEMVNAAELRVPLEIKLRSGANWGSLE